jgi:hypothetical protein
MKIRISLLVVVLLSLLAGCRTATPEPITSATDTEFTLSVGQTVSITDANLTITLLAVLSDDRCPSEIECAASGPVTLQLSIRSSDGIVTEEILQSFTDSNGLAPDRDFEGIQSTTNVDDFEIRILGISPYPKTRSDSIKPSEYKVTLKVSRHE